jgi:hypothetical protein
MAISEVCKFEVKEEIDRYIATEGISRNEASKKMAAFYTEILGVEIKPETVRQKDKRARGIATGTNVPKKSKAQNPMMPAALDGKIDDIIKHIESLKYKLIKVNGFLGDIQSKKLQLAFKKELECLQDPMGKILKEYQEAGY